MNDTSVLDELHADVQIAEYYLEQHEEQMRAKNRGDAYDATAILSEEQMAAYTSMRKRGRAAVRRIARNYRTAEFGWE